jgi:simple sugar transport system ATP-binding protein
MGFGDFEHLAAPLGLLGKVSGSRDDRICRRGECQ